MKTSIRPGTRAISVIAAGLLWSTLSLTSAFGSTNVVVNGDFDQGLVLGWTTGVVSHGQDGTPLFDAVFAQYPCPPLGFVPSGRIIVNGGADGYFEQAVTLPSSPVLNLKTWGDIAPTTVTISIIGGDNSQHIIDVFTPPVMFTGTNCTGNVPMTQVYDLAAFSGQSIKFRIEVAGGTNYATWPTVNFNSVGIWEGEAVKVQDPFVYKTVNGADTITGGINVSGNVVIPDTIAGLPIVAIGDMAFFDNSGLSSVAVPNTVSNIGTYAFAGCSGLTNATLSTNLTSIGADAFEFCGLTDLTIPGSLRNIGDSAFGDCTRLTSLTLGDGITSIGRDMFVRCTTLTSIAIPESVTSIGDYAFASCSGLTILLLSSNLTTIGSGAFQNCTLLTSITIPDSLTNFGTAAFSGSALTNISLGPLNPNFSTLNGVVFDRSQTRLILCPAGLAGPYTAPDTVTSIAENAFNSCSQLTSVTISESVTSIGDYAFASCSGLTNVSIPTNLTTIGGGAFQNCGGLTSVAIPESVTSIGDYAFASCSGLANVSIPTNLTTIGGGAFQNCSGLTSVTIPESVTSIGDYAFASCSGLMNVPIPTNLTTIGGGAFQNCGGLTSVTIPESVTSIGYYAFASCSGLRNLLLSSNLTTIGTSAFQDCTQLTSITIPDGLTNIGIAAFTGCSALTNISAGPLNPNFSSLNGVLFDKTQQVLILCPAGLPGNYIVPNSVTTIAKDAFSSCAQLTGVTIPNSVTNIGGSAFANCSRLGSLFFLGDAPVADETAFTGDFAITALYQPGTVGWEQFSTSTGIPAMLPPTVPFVRVARPTASSFGHYDPLVVVTLWATNLPFVLEASTTASSPLWVPLTTNMVTDGSFTFSDFQWTNYPGRFYRVRLQ